MAPVIPWIVGGVATLLVLSDSKKASAAAPSGSGNDLDALADMLVTETGFARDRGEMAQIVFVALNRARSYRKSPVAIVSPAARSPAWNTSSLYRSRFEAARDNPRWDAARAFASDVTAGRSGYRNLGATKFVHPGAMPVPPCAPNRVAISTSSGLRCLPDWIASGTVVGGAMFA